MNNIAETLAIATVLESDYFQGIYEGDIEKLSKVLYPGMLLVGDVQGKPYAKTRNEYLDAVKNRHSVKDSGKPFEPKIISIEVVNSIAVAKLHVKMYDFNYDEFLSLHKINEQWVIVNKMLSDIN